MLEFWAKAYFGKNIDESIPPEDESSYREFLHNLTVNYLVSQQSLTQQRIENLDEIYQKQLIWSYGLKNVDDAYFYQDWCPIGDPKLQPTGYSDDPKWQMDLWGEAAENLQRSTNRSFDYRTFTGYQKSLLRGDEMVQEYDATTDVHAREQDINNDADLDVDTLRHNIMRSYLEVSEWLGDGATAYGSQNGFVSRKMSLAWLFNAIKALINWKMENQDKWADEDIHPLMVDGGTGALASVKERFLQSGEVSTLGCAYEDELSLDQVSGYCATQERVRSADPQNKGTLKVRGNEWHSGERAWFYTHNSFIGECRFFHNARFLGQTTFDKEINGTALRSRWADLCERYASDREYEPGTLVMFGGEKDITISDGKVCNAIVTTKPGLILNGDDKAGDIMVGIALCGTVPVSVVGPVRRFDKLVASYDVPGKARRRRWYDFFKKTIGIALEDSRDDKVRCVTKMEF